MTAELDQFTEICVRLSQFAKANHLQTPELYLPADWCTFVRYNSNNALTRSLGAKTIGGVKIHYSLEEVKNALEFYAAGRFDAGTRAHAALAELRRK